MDPEKEVQIIPGIDGAPEKIPDAPETKPVKSLRTYQGDVEEAIIKNKSSSASILIAEQKRRERIPQSFGEEPKGHSIKNQLIIYGGGLLLLLGVATIATVYYLQANQKVVVIQRTKALVGFSNEKNLSIASSTRDKFISEITTSRDSSNLPLNSVLYINTTDELGAAADVNILLQLIAPRMPESLVRSFEGKYMLGIYSFSESEPFIILKTVDFPTSFSGMLKWEKDMSLDLEEIFSISKTSTTTPAFVDKSLRNKDLRILKDNSGKTILTYSFVDKNTLIITRDESTFTAILEKYFISQQTQ